MWKYFITRCGARRGIDIDVLLYTRLDTLTLMYRRITLRYTIILSSSMRLSNNLTYTNISVREITFKCECVRNASGAIFVFFFFFVRANLLRWGSILLLLLYTYTLRIYYIYLYLYYIYIYILYTSPETVLNRRGIV